MQTTTVKQQWNDIVAANDANPTPGPTVRLKIAVNAANSKHAPETYGWYATALDIFNRAQQAWGK